MQAQELEDRIAALPGWAYEFCFDGGIRTPTPGRAIVNRQQQRRRYFFERLLSLTGGTLAGRRVLDLGCNAGFWSLQALDAGADFVLGLDTRESYLEQARLVFDAKGVEPSRHRFERADVFEHDFDEPFDVVLCLGLLDRVARPLELFERIAGVGAELIVIDTEVSRARAPLFELTRLYDSRDAEHPLVLVPSRAAVAELAGMFDLRAVALALDIEDFDGMEDYRRQRRLAFICAGELPLDSLPEQPEPRLLPWWVRDPGALLGV